MKVSTLLLLITVGELIEADRKESELDLHFQQHDYKLTFERIELVSFNKEYVKELSIVTRKYNRTTPVTNFTFIFNVDVGYDLVVEIQAYKFMSNEYRYFPLRFAANFCKTISADAFGIKRLLECGTFTGCPMNKGETLTMCNFYPDPKKFPPYLPNGNYKAEVHGKHLSRELFVINFLASVSRPMFMN